MIKKLSLFLIICSMCVVHADELSNTIRFSNVQRATELLSRAVLTEKQLNKYFEIADQSIRERSKQLDGKMVGSEYYPSKVPSLFRRVIPYLLGDCYLVLHNACHWLYLHRI